MTRPTMGPSTRNPLLKQFKGWFSTNILLKIAALALAVFLWFHSDTNKVQQEDYSIPISIMLEDTALVDMSSGHGNARVLLEGQGKEFLKLLWNKPRFEFAVMEKKPKRLEIPLNPKDVIIPEGVSLRPLAILEPQSILIELDWLTEKTLTVMPMVERIEEGFIQKGKLTVEPAEVRIRGARQELKGRKSIPTELVRLPSSSGEFELVAKIDLNDFRTLKAVEETVVIRGEIERIIERRMENIAVEITGALKQTYHAKPGTIDILVTGMESRIASLKPEEIKAVLEINIPPTGETYYSPMIVLPDFVELISEQPKLFQAIPEDSLLSEDTP